MADKQNPERPALRLAVLGSAVGLGQARTSHREPEMPSRPRRSRPPQPGPSRPGCSTSASPVTQGQAPARATRSAPAPPASFGGTYAAAPAATTAATAAPTPAAGGAALRHARRRARPHHAEPAPGSPGRPKPRQATASVAAGGCAILADRAGGVAALLDRRADLELEPDHQGRRDPRRATAPPTPLARPTSSSGPTAAKD